MSSFLSECIFCRIVSGELESEIVYEDDRVVAFADVNPQAPLHLLIVPRKHIPTLLDLGEDDLDLVGHIHGVVNRLARDRSVEDGGYRVVVNCGEGAGQSVFHLHFHLLAGREFRWPPG